MSEEAEAKGLETADLSKQIKKKDMVDYLTSSSKINEDLAGSIYDQGLNSWKKLIEGTEDELVAYKGIGPAKARVLMELAEAKKDEMGEVPKPGLKEVLETVPRMNQKIISALLENGYDSFESFKDRTEEDLREINGIGPKMSSSILETIGKHIEELGSEETEEATAEMVEEEAREEPKDERSLIQRIIDAIGSFFGGKKEEKEETGEEEKPSDEEKQEPAQEKEEEKKEEAEEVPKEEPSPEETLEETPEEPAIEEEKDEPSEEKMETEEGKEEPTEEKSEEKEETKATEEAAEEKEEEKAPEEPAEEKASEEPQGFLGKLKNMLFGAKKEDAPEEVSKEAGPEEEAAEGEAISEDPAREPSEEPTEEEPVEEPPEEGTGSEEIKEFEDIPGVSKKTADILRNAGYLSIDELREAVPEDLTMIDGIGSKTAEKICNALSK